MVFVVAVGLPAILLPPGPAALAQQPLLYAVSLTLLIMSATWISALIAVNACAPFATIFWMFNYIAVSVVPLAQMNTNIFPNLVDRQFLLHAEIIFLMAGVAFTIGQAGSFIRSSAQSTPTYEIAHGWRLNLLSAAAVLLSARYAFTVGLNSLFQSRGDVGSQIAQAGLQAQNSQVGSALLTAFGSGPVFVCLLAHIIHLQDGRSGKGRTLAWIITLIAVNIVVNNPISNARYWVLTILVGTLFALRELTWIRYSATTIGGIVAALVVFPYTDVTRSSNSIENGIAFAPIAEKLSTKDYDQLTMTANGFWWVQQFGHTSGHQLLTSLAFWIPREMWPSKGLDTGVAIGLAMHSANVNLSSPLPLEFWVDFGSAGVALAFGLIGYWSRWADRGYRAQTLATGGRSSLAQLAVPIVAGCLFILMRGPLLQSMSRLSVLLLCFLVLAETVRSSSRPLSNEYPLRSKQ